MPSSILLPPEEDYISNFIVRLKTAYRVLTARKAIVVIENNLDVFNMSEMEVLSAASQIVGDMSDHIFEDFRQDIAITNLVYGD